MSSDGERKPAGCGRFGCGTIFLVVVVIAMIGQSIKWFQTRAPAARIYVVNGTDEEIQLYIDGEAEGAFPPLRAGATMGEGVAVGGGERKVVLRLNGNVLLEDSLEFERGSRYIAYSGGRWLLRSEVYYATHEFMDGGSEEPFHLDGEEVQGIEIPTPAKLDEDITPVELWTKPAAISFFGFLPGETVPDNIDVETDTNIPFASTTRSLFQLFDDESQEFHEAMRTLERPPEM